MNIWQWLESEIQSKTGDPFVIAKKQAVSGGDINQAYHLSANGPNGVTDYFVKLNDSQYADMFVKEALGLEALQQSEAIKVPGVIAFGQFEQYSYLVLHYIPMLPLGNIADFAIGLANLHHHHCSQFGFEHNNTIGRTPQINHWQDNWGHFFSEQRIGYQLDLLEQHLEQHPKQYSGSPNLIHKGRQLLPKLTKYLNRHKPKAALVHGDLWQGNFSFDHAGIPVIYDPACYYGDHEVDLAMLELFGEPGRAFFAAYSKVHPIDSGYAKRRDIYNLYHILNHASLFAGSYIQQAQRIIDKIAAGF